MDRESVELVVHYYMLEKRWLSAADRYDHVMEKGMASAFDHAEANLEKHWVEFDNFILDHSELVAVIREIEAKRGEA